MTPTEHKFIELFDQEEEPKLIEQMKELSRYDMDWIIDIVSREKAGTLISDISYDTAEKVISLTMKYEGNELPKLSLILSKKPLG